MTAFNIASLERRLAALEANRGASLRFGTVVSVDAKDNSARVVLTDGNNMETWPLRVMSRRTLKDTAQCLPDIGEQVACLFSGQGKEAGVVLGACNSQAVPGPSRETGEDYTRYEDGTEIFYDRKNHILKLNVMGDIEINATKDIAITCGGTLSLDAGLIAMQEDCE